MAKDSPIGAYLDAVARWRKTFGLVVLVTLLASIAWLLVSPPRYSASAELLVDAVPADDATFYGVPVVRTSGDPTRAMQTAAGVARDGDAAELTASRLGDGWTRERVLGSLEIQPIGESALLNVKATAGSAGEAAELANTYSEAVLRVRGREVERAVETAVTEVRRALNEDPQGGTAVELQQRLSTLLSLSDRGDFTISIAEPADERSATGGVSLPIVLMLSLVAGITIAFGATLLLDTVVPRRPVARR